MYGKYESEVCKRTYCNQIICFPFVNNFTKSEEGDDDDDKAHVIIGVVDHVFALWALKISGEK